MLFKEHVTAKTAPTLAEVFFSPYVGVCHSNRWGRRRRGSRQRFRAGATHETWACYQEHDNYQHPLRNHRKHGECQVAGASHFRRHQEQVGRPVKQHGDKNASAGMQEDPGEEDRLCRQVQEEQPDG